MDRKRYPCKLDRKIEIRSGVSYDSGDIFKIYKKSKININISLHCIESGFSQSFFDVMASGGFLLTNYQSEIEDFFETGKDIAVFHDEKELLELASYYLHHDDEREEIARNGQEKVLKNHTYRKRLTEIMRIVDCSAGLR